MPCVPLKWEQQIQPRFLPPICRHIPSADPDVRFLLAINKSRNGHCKTLFPTDSAVLRDSLTFSTEGVFVRLNVVLLRVIARYLKMLKRVVDNGQIFLERVDFRQKW